MLRDLKWDRRIRLQFIEVVAYWEGSVDTTRLMQQFEISRPQAIKEFKLYQEMFPETLDYEDSKKRYCLLVSSPPLFPKGPDINNYMNLITIGSKPEWLESLGYPAPSVRRVNAYVVSRVVSALRNNIMARVKYQALESADVEERIIKPTKLINTGYRWHIRGLREKRGEIGYRDFLLPRFTNFLGFVHTSFRNEPKDTEWNTRVSVELQINPRIRNRERRRIIQEEFGMNSNGILQIETNAAMVKYILDCYTIDVDSDACNYEKNLLSVRNYPEIRKYLLKPKDLGDEDV